MQKLCYIGKARNLGAHLRIWPTMLTQNVLLCGTGVRFKGRHETDNSVSSLLLTHCAGHITSLDFSFLVWKTNLMILIALIF